GPCSGPPVDLMALPAPRYSLVQIVRRASRGGIPASLAVAVGVGAALGLLVMRGGGAAAYDDRPAPSPAERHVVADSLDLSDEEWIGPILTRNVFDPEVAKEATAEWDGWQDDGSEDFEVPFLLMGTVVAVPADHSSAMLVEAVEDGARRIVGIGDALGEGLTVVEIAIDHIVVQRENGDEMALDLAGWEGIHEQHGAPDT